MMMADSTPNKISNTSMVDHVAADLSLVSSPSPQITQHGAGNLTGDLRKVKDTAADIFNLVSKWDSLNTQGMNILTDMANIMIEKLFSTQEEDIGAPVKTIPRALEPLCSSLEQIVESMEAVVEKMGVKVTLAVGLISLQQFKMAKPISQVLFLTMTLEDFASTVKTILEDYRQESKLKRKIYENVAHSSDRNTVMFYLASWVHQPYIHLHTPDLIQALIKDTGHVK